jgi:PAS domain S-box-containing protein
MGTENPMDTSSTPTAEAADARVEAERASYEELFELAPVGYAVTDLDGVVRAANRYAARLLATEPSALVGKPLALFVPLGARRAFREDLQRIASSAGTYRWRTYLVPSDGTRLVVDITVAWAPAEWVMLRWVLHDATEQTSLEPGARRLATD